VEGLQESWFIPEVLLVVEREGREMMDHKRERVEPQDLDWEAKEQW
jgi:hypothetical protein